MQLLRAYLKLLGAALLLQGSIALSFSIADLALSGLTHRLFGADRLHALIHIGWGVAILFLLRQPGRTKSLGLAFGAFYLALGILGVLVYHPLGLRLGFGENGFHLLAGSIALLLTGSARSQVKGV